MNKNYNPFKKGCLSERNKKMYREIVKEIRANKNADGSIENAALSILNASGTVEIPVGIVDICKKLGILVYQQELPEKICGYIVINGAMKDELGSDKIISVNARETNKRRRFTVAHELGHYLFDFDPGENIEYFDKFELDHRTGVPEEDRANRFAAELLMPKTQFKTKFDELKQKHDEYEYYDAVLALSDYFLVPQKSVDRRIREELNLSWK